MEALKKPVGVFWVFLLSSLCFLCCFLYLQYGVVSAADGGASGALWFRRRRQQDEEGPVGSVSGGGGCDLFDGKWVFDDSYPLYEAGNCAFLDEGFQCSQNGRPDTLYSKWRWQPTHCKLPRFNAKLMLERLRNRRLVFVGDSIGRNQWESLLCMLSSAVTDNSSVYEVNGSPITKHNGFLVFKFKDFNCTVEYYRAPFLVLQSRAPAGSPDKVKTTIKLDVMDWTSWRWKSADVLIFNTGHWWNYEKTIRSGCYFQVGSEVKLNMSIKSAYRRSLETLLDWIHKEVNTSKSHIVYRTYSPVHFSGGDWRTGGTCHQENLPHPEVPQLSSEDWALRILDEVLSGGSSKGVGEEINVLNITQMSAQRKDGHSSIYYLGPSYPAPVHRQDCSHWCLPGVPDVWNELLYALFLEWEFTSPRKNSTAASGGGGISRRVVSHRLLAKGPQSYASPSQL